MINGVGSRINGRKGNERLQKNGINTLRQV